jgi:hypothetical protein
LYSGDKLGVGFIYVAISITTTLLVLAFICSLCYCLALRRRKNRQHLTNNTVDRNGNGNFVADASPPSAPPIEMNAYPHTLVNPTSRTATAAATDINGGKISKGNFILFPKDGKYKIRF